jgi:hypothetical protein
MRVEHMVLIKPVEPKILILPGVRVILDSELAELYGVQVKRNQTRFPQDFMFQLSPREDKNLRSQFATSRSGHGGRRHLALRVHGTWSNYGSDRKQHEACDRDQYVRRPGFRSLT